MDANQTAEILTLLAEHDLLLAEIARRDAALREAESEARRFAGCYPHGSDGRNTFVMLADKIAALQPSETPKEEGK